jgi:L-lysine 6-transaminase
MAQFVEAFARTLPHELNSHLFFIDGGALAVENAMKAAFDWKRRKNAAAGRGDQLGTRIIHLTDAFHGRSGYTMSVTNTDPAKVMYFPKFDWPRVHNPSLRFPVTAEVLAEVEQAETRSIREIEQALVDHKHDIAGLLIEPIQGEGGDNHFRAEYLRKLRELADENEFLLLFDEVQTGFGVTGHWWCHEHFGVIPDVMAFGKKTQICGIAASSRLDEVDSVFQVSSRINSTWGGNLVDMIRSQAIVETIEQDDLLPQVRQVGEQLKLGLEKIAENSGGKITNIRGRGFFLALDLPSAEDRARSLAAMLDENVLGLASGRRSVRFRPPLILDADTAQIGLERIAKAFAGVL